VVVYNRPEMKIRWTRSRNRAPVVLFLGLAATAAAAGVLSLPGQQGDFPQHLTGPYLGQISPGGTPGIFALGIVCTGKYVLNAAFSPDLKEFFYATMDSDRNYTILQMREVEGRWTRPRIAPFSGTHSEADPFITPDGRRLFFPSNRPLSDGSESEEDYNIWMVERTDEGWAGARPLEPPVNLSGSMEIYPTVTQDGTLYFSSDRDGGRGGSDIYRSRWEKGEGFGEPENLGRTINTSNREFDAFIAADESFLIFSAYGRSDGLGQSDLYISFRQGNRRWSKPVNLGVPFNSRQSEFTPIVSPDGKYFFFTSTRLGQGDIYWVEAAVLEKFRGIKEPR
jgi:Tol biopolymer transport system component